MPKHRVTLVPGDGTGPEVVAVAQRCVEAAGVVIEWDVQRAGAAAMEETGTPLPESVLGSIRATKVGLKGPVTTPVASGFRSVNVALRQRLGLFACLRPCKYYKGVRSRYENVDLVVVRENTEDLYAGIEFEEGRPGTAKLIEEISGMAGKAIPGDSGISIKPISRTGTSRIARFAFEYARRNGRRKVTCIHKANIMKYSDGLFLNVSREVASEFPDVQFEDVIVDIMCAQLVRQPENYDVLLCPNLYGDILSELCAGLVGGVGVTPGANIGDEIIVFEPVHGSAPKYANLNRVNPVATILSAVLMLRHLGEGSAADRLEAAVAKVIAEGKYVTYDLKPSRDDPTAVGTREMGEAVCRAMGGSL